jgi:hypothetical protein
MCKRNLNALSAYMKYVKLYIWFYYFYYLLIYILWRSGIYVEFLSFEFINNMLFCWYFEIPSIKLDKSFFIYQANLSNTYMYHSTCITFPNTVSKVQIQPELSQDIVFL